MTITDQMKNSRKMQSAMREAKSNRNPVNVANYINKAWPNESLSKRKEIFYWVNAVALADFARSRKYPF